MDVLTVTKRCATKTDILQKTIQLRSKNTNGEVHFSKVSSTQPKNNVLYPNILGGF